MRERSPFSMRSTPGGFGGGASLRADLTRPAGPPSESFFNDFSFIFLVTFFEGFWEDTGCILEPFWSSKCIKKALKNGLLV